jgi:hypothetical protein
MKRYFFLFSLILVRVVANEQPVVHLPAEGNLSIQNGKTNERFSPIQGNDIIGSWSLLLQAFDDNSNGKPDDAERKKGNAGRHFYQFNADGTCLIHTMKMKGTYEVKKESGKTRLYTYIDDQGTKTRENAWYLISVSKTELILLSQDKFTFWIYKRV